MTEWAVFLGGYDLEMVEIARLLAPRPDVTVHDHALAWGARASAYATEVRDALARGQRVALIELPDDLPADLPRDPITWIDHHGMFAGADRPTSIEQVFRLLNFPPEQWTRDRTLVAANDRGHIRGLLQAGATPEEIRDIRARDRAAQGITPDDERLGREALARAESHFDGRLTVVRLPHTRTATVTDPLDPVLGGPGYRNLVVLCPPQTVFFGSGRGIAALRRAHPDGWFGGDLPDRGYWGVARPLPEPDLLRTLESPIVTLTPWPAANIPVRSYRQILFWPLILKQQPFPQGGSRQFDEWLSALKPAWGDPVPTLPANVTPAMGDDITFEEVVYFHPFVRDFLYGDGDESVADRPLQRLKRTDVTGIEVEFVEKGPTLTLDVDRLELYLCKPLVAILVLDVHNPRWSDAKEFTLADVLHLQSMLRQVHPPYFFGSVAGNCPHAVTFVTRGGRVRSDFDAGRDHFARFTHLGAEPPVASHWQHLLAPLKPFPGSLKKADGEHTPAGSGMFYQQIEDDRMPGMTFLTVPDPRVISDGDFDRLTWCDTPGARRYPYAGDFLNTRRAGHTYDRYWDGRHAVAPDDYDTRYLCSGYQFVMVGSSNNPHLRDFLWDHFRRHYFRMGLILHCQRSALLKFQDEMSEAVKLISGQSPDREWSNANFRERVSYIQMTFLKFRTRVGFTEVSNQLQGRELFAWWMSLLGTDKLFAQVDGECQRLHDGMSEYETRQLARTQMRLAELQAEENKEMKTLSASQEQLARVATRFLPVSVVLSFLALLFAGDFLPKFFDPNSGHAAQWTFVVLTVIGLLVGMWWARRLRRKT